MIFNKVAKIYSQALFELGDEKRSLREIKKELNEFVDFINTYTDLKKILFHPRVLAEDKKNIIKRIFSSDISTTVLNFLNILIDKRREKYIELIVREFNKMVNIREGILEVELVSAIDVPDDLKERLRDKLKGFLNKEIIFKDRLEPSIIGGLILKIGDQVIDGSIRHSLNFLKEKIERIPVSELGVE
jgi:F-type H+-transporting ATPase subunit delta